MIVRQPYACAFVFLALLSCCMCLFAQPEVIVPDGADLSQAVTNATSGDILVLQGAHYPLAQAIDIEKTISIRGYAEADGPCDALPTAHVITGQSLDCANDPVINGNFEAGPTGLDWAAVPPPYPYEGQDLTGDPAPTLNDIITTNGTPYAGTFHALFRVPPYGGPAPTGAGDLRLEYDTPLPLLPDVIREGVKWTPSGPGVVAPAECKAVNLITDSPIVLPVLPQVIVETLRNTAFTYIPPAAHLTLWLMVPHYSGHPADRLEVTLNGTPLPPLTGGLGAFLGYTWTPWNLDIAALGLMGTPASLEIKLTSNTEVANPTVVLIGAVEIRNDLAPLPSPQGLTALDLLAQEYTLSPALPAIGFAPSTNVLFDLTVIPTTLPALGAQQKIIRLGGIGLPQASLNLRAPHKEPMTAIIDTVTLMADLGVGNPDIPLSPPYTVAEIPTDFCQPYDFPLSLSLLDLPLQLKLSLCLTPIGNGSIVVVDDLFLGYLSKAFRSISDNFTHLGNLISNPSFESGPVNYTIDCDPEHPACPALSDVIKATPNACRGAQAAVFEAPPSQNFLTVWMRSPQQAPGWSDDVVELWLVTGSQETLFATEAATAIPMDEYMPFSFAFAPPPGGLPYSFEVRSAFSTRVATPPLVLVGAMEITDTDLTGQLVTPTPEAVRMAPMPGLVDAVPAVLPPGIPNEAIPPILLPLVDLAYALPGDPHAARLGGLGTNLTFDLKRPTPAGMPDGFSKFSVLRNGFEVWTISDLDPLLANPDTCAAMTVSPNQLAPRTGSDTHFDLAFRSLIEPNSYPAQPYASFLLDNTCLSHVTMTQTLRDALGVGPCFSNRLIAGGFEETDADSWWSVLPDTVPFVDIVLGSPNACEGTKAAVFIPRPVEQYPVWQITLEQINISINTADDTLTLYLRTEHPNVDDDPAVFLCQMVDQGTNEIYPLMEILSTKIADDTYQEYRLPIPPALQGRLVTLHLIARLPRTNTAPFPASFAVDNVSICRDVVAPLLFNIKDNGYLTLEHVTLEGATTGVSVAAPTARLALNRAKIRTMEETAVDVSNGQQVHILNSVLHGNKGRGLHVHGLGAPEVVVLQSTLRNNGDHAVLLTAPIALNLAATLIDGNGAGVWAPSDSQIPMALNWIQNNDYVGTVIAGFDNVDVSLTGHPTPNYAAGQWQGKLTAPLLPTMNTTYAELLALFPPPADRIHLPPLDFECDPRIPIGTAQIGADQVFVSEMCPADAIIDHGPVMPADPTPEMHYSNDDTYVYQPLPTLETGAIKTLRWWGIWKDTANNASEEPPDGPLFTFESYDTGFELTQRLEEVAPTASEALGHIEYPLDDNAILYRYDYTFNVNEFSVDSFLSIQGENRDDGYRFFWAGSTVATPPGLSYLETPLLAALSLCVSEYITSDECYEGAIYSRAPIHPRGQGQLYHASSNDNMVYDLILLNDIDSSPIKFFEFWGIWLESDDACEEPEHGALSVRYVGTPSLASAVTADIVPVEGSLTIEKVDGVAFETPEGENASLYRYLFRPAQSFPVSPGAMTHLWLSVYQSNVSASACRFQWVVSPDGAGNAVRWVGPGNSPEALAGADVFHRTMSLCLYLELPVPTVTGCAIQPAMIGRNETARLTLFGQNLLMLDAVVLIPEMPLPGVQGMFANPNDPSLHVILPAPDQRLGRMGEEISIPIRFNAPFNEAAAGNPICTDGRATFATISSGTASREGVEGCTLLIDTIPPRLIVLDGPPTNHDASLMSPAISANRVPYPGMPMDWVPGMSTIVTPKNAAGYSSGDVYVYVNPGSRNDVSYSAAHTAAPGGGPNDFLSLTVSAQFEDPMPSDLSGVPYPVERAGFIAAATSAPPQSWTPFQYPLDTDDTILSRGTARWNPARTQLPFLTATGIFTIGADGVIPNATLSAQWNAGAAYSTSEPWRISFTPEAVDRAGNRQENDPYHTINIYWLFRVRAQFQSEMESTIESPELYWRLDRSFEGLLEAAPACAPLARFYLYEVIVPETGLLSPIGRSDWRRGPLRGTTLFTVPSIDTIPFQQLLAREYFQGKRLCVAILGADETGNIQYDPGNGTYNTLQTLTNQEIDYRVWDNGERRLPNLALDTSLRLELFHEQYRPDENPPFVRIRDYGPATRVPLPPWNEVCVTRVNGLAQMRALTPTADRVAAVGDRLIIWKFFRESALVARGVLAPDTSGEFADENLLALLLNTNEVPTAAGLETVDANGYLIRTARRLPLPAFLTDIRDYADCLVVDEGAPPCTPTLFHRLGDEGCRPNPAAPNAPSQRRREIRYTLTAQTALVYAEQGRDEMVLDQTPATVSFSIYVRDVEDQIRDETPVREFGR